MFSQISFQVMITTNDWKNVSMDCLVHHEVTIHLIFTELRQLDLV